MSIRATRHPRAERALGIVAIIGGALAVIAGNPTRPTRGTVNVSELASIVEHEEDHVAARELAQWIRAGKPGLRVLDIRSDSAFDELHIPTAQRVPLSDVARMRIDSTATYVLYSEGGTHAAQGWFLLRARGVRNVYFLRGGLYEWVEQVMSPRVASTTPQAERDSIRALTLWFGGRMEVVDSAAAPRALDGKLPAPPAEGIREAARKIRRRSC